MRPGLQVGRICWNASFVSPPPAHTFLPRRMKGTPRTSLGLHSLPALSRKNSGTGSAGLGGAFPAKIRTLWVGARLEPPHIYPFTPNPSILLQQPRTPEGGSTLLALRAKMLETGVGAVCTSQGKRPGRNARFWVSHPDYQTGETMGAKEMGIPPRNPMLGEKKGWGRQELVSWHEVSQL